MCVDTNFVASSTCSEEDQFMRDDPAADNYIVIDDDNDEVEGQPRGSREALLKLQPDLPDCKLVSI